MDTTIVEAKVPAGLLSEMEALVEGGWFQDMNDLIVDALRRFLEAHRPELIESYVWQDVEWGLHGKD